MSWTVRLVRGIPEDLPAARVNIVIDVIRAFTTTHVALGRGAREVLLVREVSRAREYLGMSHIRVAGERDALRIEGFDFGNSPVEFLDADLQGQRLVLTTTNGVPATHASLRADKVFVTGFTNARTLARHVREQVEPGLVHLVASRADSDEDVACAEYLERALLGDEPAPAPFLKRVRESEAAQKFLDPEQPRYDVRDVEYAAQILPGDFVMTVAQEAEGPVVRALSVT